MWEPPSWNNAIESNGLHDDAVPGLVIPKGDPRLCAALMATTDFVLLYELLAGCTPFNAQQLLASGIDTMRQIIRQQDPARPVTRFGTLRESESAITGSNRSTDTTKLMHQLRGDLDWIIMKRIEKDRTRRYEMANGLAFDRDR